MADEPDEQPNEQPDEQNNNEEENKEEGENKNQESAEADLEKQLKQLTLEEKIKQLKAQKEERERKEKEKKREEEEKKRKEKKEKEAKTLQFILFIILEIIGIAVMLSFGWMFGLPIIIGTGYFAYQKGEFYIPRITVIVVMMMVNFIRIIPQHETISILGVTIGAILIILLLPEQEEINEKDKDKERKMKNKHILFTTSLILIIFDAVWVFISVHMIGRGSILASLMMASILTPMVAASFIMKTKLELKKKTAAIAICFAPLLIFGIRALVVAGGALFGSFTSNVQHMISGGVNPGRTNTLFDMILNPKLAVQAQFKPPSTKEVRETAGSPQIAFDVSGDSIPKTGCYESTTFQLFGKVKNTGTVHIVDLKLTMSPEKEIGSPCNDIDTTNCNWRITSIPTGVTASRNCMINPVPFGTTLGIKNTQSRTCFIAITAETGYHSIARLPVSLIQKDYAISKFEQKQLTMRVVPSTSSIGPVDLSLGGFEQPIITSDTPDTFVLRVSVSNSGNGEVGDYKSVYVYIPNAFLNDKHQCYNENADLVCLSQEYNRYVNSYECSLLDEPAKTYCNNLLSFKNNNLIGGYSQFSYDNSDYLLNEDYSICFLKKTSDDLKNFNLATCNLKPGKDIMKSYDLRKTLLIRGDVLYTYKVRGETSIVLQDCSAS